MFDRTPTGLDIGNSRILVVDDEPVNVELVERVLARAGFRSVESVTDPTMVEARFDEIRPHAVLLDLRMPGLDGLTLLHRLQPKLFDAGTAVIVVTAEGDRGNKLEALRRGAYDFIMKPFDPLELVSRVRNACEVQELHRRLCDENARLEDAVRARTARLEAAVEVLRQAETTLTRNLADAQGETRAKDMMLAAAAHDFRAPLNAICGFAEVIRDQTMGPVGNPRYAGYAGDIHGAARYLLGIVEDVLDLSKLQAGAEELHLSEVPVQEVVRASVDLLRDEAERAGVRLNLRVPPGPLTVRTDETKLRRIVINMTSNALKFTPAGGSVTVEVAPDPHGGAMVLIIRDTGVGIAAEDLPTALRPFGQLRGMQREHGGTGLGMPLTKALVEALGGRFEIASEPGRGTCVTIRLPAAPVAAGHAA
jgi:signal transduction histidine kinase